jgi:hypothetical protein
MVAEAEGEGLIAGFEDPVEKDFDVFLVFLDEFSLTAACVDDETDAQGELTVVSEEADFLGDSVFEDGEVVLGEAGYDVAVGVPHTEGSVDEMGLHLNNRDVLCVADDCQ